MENKQNDNRSDRLLGLYIRLSSGQSIRKREEAARFSVSERSIQRDIDDIRAALSDNDRDPSIRRQVVYDRRQGGFVMTGSAGSLLSNDEILAVSKILLESRAFTKGEISTILDKLIAGCVPRQNLKLVSDLVANEKFHYVELRHKSAVKDKLWAIGEEIKKYNLLEIKYEKAASAKETVTRIVQPVGLIFSEYYFYLNAFIVEKGPNGEYRQVYDYPAVFRIDRILSYKETGGKFRIPYADRFEEGEFRKKVQFMFPGNLLRITFRYSGRNVESVLDRLPTARVVSESEDGSIVEAVAYGRSLIMWLLSQGKNIEVLSPAWAREEMKTMLTEMLAMYS